MITGGIVVASNVYYGICTTAGDTQNKQVQLVNVSSELEGFHLQKGDILSVYFVNKNEANGVILTLFIGDINQEYNSSTSVDESGFNTSTIGVAPGAWTDGEVVIFSYTHNGSVVENADNNYYWEMVGKPIATSDTYGDVILDGDDLGTAASQNKVNALIDARGVKELAYDDVSTGSTVIGHLRLDTHYSDSIVYQDPPIDITIPDLPKNVSYFKNDAGYIKNPIGTSLLFNGTESNSRQIGVNTEGESEGGTIIIDLCDDSNSDTIINSLNDINLNPTGHVNITLPTNESQLNVLGGNGIACDKLDILNGENNRLTVDKIKSHTPEPNLITFESPVNIPNGPNTVNGLQTDGITIGNDSLPTYIANFLRTNLAKPPLNDWLADQLDDYLLTKRYYYGPITNIGIDTQRVIHFGTTEQYWYLKNGQREYVTGSLNLDGYDIVGIIAWEAWRGIDPYHTNIYSIWWENNDPSTGILGLRMTAVTKPITNINVSVDILYKKQLRTINTTGE